MKIPILTKVTIVITAVSLVLAVVSLVYASMVQAQVNAALHSDSTVAKSDDSSEVDEPSTVTDMQYATKYYPEVMDSFAYVSKASSAVIARCDELRDTFISGLAATSGTGYYKSTTGVTFDDPADPLASRDSGHLKCQDVGAYVQKSIADGDKDPGYGVTYSVSTPLSINASISTKDEKEKNSARLYSRYTGLAYAGTPITGKACSIQTGSKVTYLRTVSPDDPDDYRYGSLVRYMRPSTPTADTDGARYAGTPECKTGELIVVGNFQVSDKTKLTIVK